MSFTLMAPLVLLRRKPDTAVMLTGMSLNSPALHI